MNKSMSDYYPRPIDTSAVVLPVELAELAEFLARNTHEVWAAERMEQGWQYGPERDDARKLHPCLVPYEELSESEKEFDRATAVQTLKVVQALGFSISRGE